MSARLALEHSKYRGRVGRANGWDPPSQSLRRDKLYGTHGTYMTESTFALALDHRSAVTPPGS